LITVTEEAKEILGGYEFPQGTVVRLDFVNGHQRQDQFCVRIGAGLPEDDDQIVEHRGEDLLRIARHVSEELNGSTVDRVETLDGPAVGLKSPPLPGNLPLTDGS
jgi:hypothetical protein